MAVDMAASYRLQDVEQATEAGPGDLGTRHGPYTGIAIFDGEQWASICRELDVASAGSTADEALANLIDAVQEYLAAVREQGGDLSAERRVPNPDMRDFLLGHQGQEPINYLSFAVR